MGYKNGDNELIMTGRIKDVINIAGIKVAPFEIEAVLNEHPDVYESAVIGVDNDMYGEVVRSTRLAGLSTDRFVVKWELSHPRVEAAIAGRPPEPPDRAISAPIANAEATTGKPIHPQLERPKGQSVRIEVPADLHSVKGESMEAAREWRLATREAFLHYLSAGYHVIGFHRDAQSGRCFYLLTEA